MCRAKGQSYKKPEDLVEIISISIDPNLLKKMDMARGGKNRSLFISDIIREYIGD